MASEHILPGRMDEITNEGDGEGPGCLMDVAVMASMVIVSAICIATVIAMIGYTLAN